MDVLYGLSAGVMLAASAFSLLIPALEMGSIWEISIGFIAGALLIEIGDLFIPHLHPIYGLEGPEVKAKESLAHDLSHGHT